MGSWCPEGESDLLTGERIITCGASNLDQVKCHLFSCVWLFVTLWTVAHQAPLSMEFSRQEFWSELPCPPSGDLPNPGIKPMFVKSPALRGSLPLAPLEKPLCMRHMASSRLFVHITIWFQDNSLRERCQQLANKGNLQNSTQLASVAAKMSLPFITKKYMYTSSHIDGLCLLSVLAIP